jgi:hypothetical protein
MKVNIIRCSGKVPIILVFLSDFNHTWKFLGIFSKNTGISGFMQIRPVGAQLLHTDGQTDGRKLMVAFRNFANAPKNCPLYDFFFWFSAFLSVQCYVECTEVVLPLSFLPAQCIFTVNHRLLRHTHFGGIRAASEQVTKLFMNASRENSAAIEISSPIPPWFRGTQFGKRWFRQPVHVNNSFGPMGVDQLYW